MLNLATTPQCVAVIVKEPNSGRLKIEDTWIGRVGLIGRTYRHAMSMPIELQGLASAFMAGLTLTRPSKLHPLYHRPSPRVS
jgi:hypothetical protein